MTEGKKAKTKPVEDVDHAGDTSVLAERYDPRAVVVHHSLVVNQTNVLHRYVAAIVFSERELMFMFAICHRASVCLSSVCNVRAPYSAD